MLHDYVTEAQLRGGHTPHVMEKALSWHTRYRDTGSMLPPERKTGISAQEMLNFAAA